MARIESFDGIRGVAVLLVVFHHFNNFLGVRSAQLGVDMFLVLSGFLITSLLMSEIDRTAKISFTHFFAKRALRLVPALVVTIIIFGGGALIFGYGDPHSTLWAALWSLLYVSNWVRSLDLMDLGLFSHTWTLSMEEQFYVVWPVILLVSSKALPRFRACILVAFAMVVVCQATLFISVMSSGQTVWVSSSFPTRAGALFLGSLAAILVRSDYLEDAKPLIKRLSFPCAAVVVTISIGPSDYFIWKQPVAVFACAVVILFLATNRDTPLHRLLEPKWLTYIGRISYGVYLYNFPVVWFGSFVFTDPEISEPAKQAYVVLLLIPLTFMISWASYRFIEAPILRFKERLSPSLDFGSGGLRPAPQAK